MCRCKFHINAYTMNAINAINGSVETILYSMMCLDYTGYMCLNTFLASGDICCLLLTFTNSLDPDQDRHSVGSDLDPNPLTL